MEIIGFQRNIANGDFVMPFDIHLNFMCINEGVSTSSTPPDSKVEIREKYSKQDYLLVFSFVKNNGGSCYNLEMFSCLLLFYLFHE